MAGKQEEINVKRTKIQEKFERRIGGRLCIYLSKPGSYAWLRGQSVLIFSSQLREKCDSAMWLV